MIRQIGKRLRDFALLTAMILVALGVVGYIFVNQAARPRLPWEAEPFHVDAAFSQASAVVPGQGQSVRIAGVQVGLVSGVRIEDGQAVVGLNLDPRYRGYIRGDATALLRPRTGVKDMFVELDPGTAAAAPMPDHGRIPVANTEPDINSDEVLSALDSDTRAYLQLLVNGAGKGLRGRGGDLRGILRVYAPLHRDVARVASAFAARRRDLAELVHDYGALMAELGDRSGDLGRLVTAANQTFGAFASQENEISSAVALFPPALRSSSSALASVDRLAGVLPPALRALRPAVRTLDTTNAKVIPAAREGTPILADQVRPLVRAARPYVTDLRPAARGLNTATPDLTAANHEFNRFFDIAAYNPGGAQKLTGDPVKDRARDEGYLYWLAWVTQNSSSLFSTSDASGPFRRIQLVASCSTWKTYADQIPGAEVVFGLTSLLRDPKLCGSAG